MPGVVAPLISDHVGHAVREVVGDLALALVPPLGPDDDGCWHGAISLPGGSWRRRPGPLPGPREGLPTGAQRGSMGAMRFRRLARFSAIVPLTVALAMLSTACGGGAATPGATTSTEPPTGLDAGGGFNYNRTIVAFCVARERIDAKLAILLRDDPEPNLAIGLLADARREVLSTLDDLEAGGRTDLIPAVKRWARSFSAAQRLSREGASAVEAMLPVRRELLKVDRIQSCELDNQA